MISLVPGELGGSSADGQSINIGAIQSDFQNALCGESQSSNVRPNNLLSSFLTGNANPSFQQSSEQ